MRDNLGNQKQIYKKANVLTVRSVFVKHLYYQLVILILFSFLPLFSAFADLHVIYENRNNPSEIIEIYSKNSKFRVVTTFNEVKVVNLIDEKMFLFKVVENRYLELDIPKEEPKKVKKQKKEMFSPTHEILKEKVNVAGIPASLMKYRSAIDSQRTVYLSKLIPGDEIAMMKICLSYLPVKGINFLKDAAYYYALDNGFIPLRIKGRKYDWKATLIEMEGVKEELFDAPAGMKKWKKKDYLRSVVEKASEGMDSKINP